MLSLKYNVFLVVYSDLKFFVEIEKFCVVIGKFGSVMILVDRININLFRGLFNVSSFIGLLNSIVLIVMLNRLVSLNSFLRFNFIEVFLVVNKRLGFFGS